MKRRQRTNERGSTFILVTFLVITSTALIGAYLSTSLGKVRHVENQAAKSAAFHAAEAGLNAGIESLWNLYRNASPVTRMDILADADGSVDPDNRFEEEFRLSSFVVTVGARETRHVPREHVDMELVAVARRDDQDAASRTLRAVVRFELEQSRVFDHAYFINNFGWFWGNSITANGDVRSNGNFSLRYNPMVNGDVYAAVNDDLRALGEIEGTARVESWTGYNNNGRKHRQARPTNPSAETEDLNGNGQLDGGEDRNDNGLLDTFEYAGGFDGESEHIPGQQQLEMPYLGDLAVYRHLANHNGGTISQGGTTLVTAVSGDDEGEPRHVVLVGTRQDPIVLDGPVVIEGDVVIKGYITGRGTIYAGRNVHIVGDLVYANPPEWLKPLETPEETRTQNETRDQIGLVAKGSVVMGDYTDSNWRYYVEQYSRPPFTQPYVVDPSDEPNGYVTGYDNEGRPNFNGDYTATDGGTKEAVPPVAGGNGNNGNGNGNNGNNGNGNGNNGNGNDPVAQGTPRRYYESSFPDDYIRDIADNHRVQQVDAVVYTNHLLTGLIGPTIFNGALISRDEAIVYYSHIEMNHDNRIRGNGYEFMDIWLPREPSYRILYWSEELE